jgi:hypothetical protein
MQESMKAAAEIQQKRMESISQKVEQRMREFIEASQDKSASPK